MTRQMIIALTVAVLFAGTNSAQPPADTPSPPPAAVGAPPTPVVPLAPYDDFSAPGRLWFSADYLSGWVQPARLPPLVTTSPAGTPLAQAGVLGLPATSV